MKRRHENHASDRAPQGGHTGDDALVSLIGHKPSPLLPPEIAPVLHRLRAMLGEAIEQGRRVGVELTAPRLASICEELIREAREPGYRPSFENSVEGIFLSGVFDDLVQQPSNIFAQVVGTDNREYYVPLTPSQGSPAWKRCGFLFCRTSELRFFDETAATLWP